MILPFDAHALYADCISLVLFRSVRKKPLFRAFEKMLKALSSCRAEESLLRRADFFSRLADASAELDWKSECASYILADENAFTRSCEQSVPALPLELSVKSDLRRFERLACVFFADVENAVQELCVHAKIQYEPVFSTALVSQDNEDRKFLKKTIALPTVDARFEALRFLLCTTCGWDAQLETLRRFWAEGAGIFTSAYAFVWKHGDLSPVKNCASVPIEYLYGYEPQRSLVFENTARFAAGHRANNLLLYGDRGTGKSATVKSTASFFASSSDEKQNKLRIVEVRKEQLDEFTRITDTLRKRPFRFIVFIDDLSFNETDERYIGLKALLEGGLESRPDNVILYATSNRRHLVKEKATDRVGLGSLDADAEIRAEDAVQEHLSLADRFGMTVIFSSPDQDEYLHLVFGMLKERSLSFDENAVRVNALRWEKWYNGRSPRTARQFADWFISGEAFPWDEKPEIVL